MEKHYCDRCELEILNYTDKEHSIIINASGRENDLFHAELCKACKEELLDCVHNWFNLESSANEE